MFKKFTFISIVEIPNNKDIESLDLTQKLNLIFDVEINFKSSQLKSKVKLVIDQDS